MMSIVEKNKQKKVKEHWEITVPYRILREHEKMAFQETFEGREESYGIVAWVDGTARARA